ncbi:DNA-directed RNA polymerase, subunit 2 [Kipferlia bialata]|uniref:DNA-directed RNA polymerase n=1 Tax=Kipferlia bialata TaxID=797122 RepID=A0A9K3GJK3_9EUKA|nr:DNA-directed RNA polymerase, subunit 2 [Kipferlia bialata]|eukprot:g6103.t1
MRRALSSGWPTSTAPPLPRGAHGDVFLDGEWLGVLPPNIVPDNVVTILRNLRRNGFNIMAAEVGDDERESLVVDAEENPFRELSISYDRGLDEIQLTTDEGRMSRPLLVVKQTHDLEQNKTELVPTLQRQHLNEIKGYDSAALGWNHLMNEQCIEYVDVEEEETCLVAMDIGALRQAHFKGTRRVKPGEIRDPVPLYTHCEIHPSSVLGVLASLVPFPDHNQSPRNTYQCAMGKQALGIYALSFHLRMDTHAHLLHYPQSPMVTTHAMKHIHFTEMPAGQNVIVGISCYSGYNQEDSVIMSQASVDRGLFRTAFTRCYRDTASRKLNNAEIFRRPGADTIGRRNPDLHLYDTLEEDGLPRIGAMIGDRKPLIGKLIPTAVQTADSQYQDDSTFVRPGEAGFVDRVVLAQDGDGNMVARVRIRILRVPQVGDKFSSRHGQKGTCGLLFTAADMPYALNGIMPDMVINPHALPSRMTIAQLMECLAGKVGALAAEPMDATPFSSTAMTVQTISSRLHKLGYQRNGNECLINGQTGIPLQAKVFMGPTFYQRLKHMVLDKVHSRSTGPVQALTRQPVEGRIKSGGMRMGEMEKDCMVAHGATSVLRDRLLFHSDATTMRVCQQCGMPGYQPNLHSERPECRHCGSAVLVAITIPYAAKLLMQELMGMGIAPRIMTQEPGCGGVLLQ